MALRPGEVGAVGREGDCPGLAARLLVEGGRGHQELADELGLFCQTSRKKQVRVGPGGGWSWVTPRVNKNKEVEPARDQGKMASTNTSGGFNGVKRVAL